MKNTIDFEDIKNNIKKIESNINKNTQSKDNDKTKQILSNCDEDKIDKKYINNYEKTNTNQINLEDNTEIIYDDGNYYNKIKTYKYKYIEWTNKGEKKVFAYLYILY